MRHGLMCWREDELSQVEVRARQARLQALMKATGLDALVVYTNNVRSGGVTFATGFTPYWNDALLLLPVVGQGIFVTALSKRVGHWIKLTNPTVEVIHSPQQGRLIGERLAAVGARKVGVVELSHLPGGLVEEISAMAAVELVDASDLFADVRTHPDAAELRLVAKADQIAAAAFARTPVQPKLVGDVTEVLELSVRNAGAEECYVATAPDLESDARLARTKGKVALGVTFAVRLSLAYQGVWVRRTESLASVGEGKAIASMRAWADAIAGRLELTVPLGPQLAGADLPVGFKIEDWALEAPIGTRPLERVASQSAPTSRVLPYGVLSLRLASDGAPLLLARTIGIASADQRMKSAA